MSTRTIQNRLNSGELKGKRTLNQYGVSEWRVWPNRELSERGKGLFGDADEYSTPTSEFQGGDSTAVVDVNARVLTDNTGELIEKSQREQSGEAIDPVGNIARVMAKEFADRLKQEQLLNSHLQKELAEKERQSRAEQLEQKVAELDTAKSELERSLQAEIESLKLKTAEGMIAASKLAELEKTVQDLQKPQPSWFQRFFLGSKD